MAVVLASAPARETPRAETTTVSTPARTPVRLDELLAYADGRAPLVARARSQVSFGAAEITAARPLVIANPTIGTAVGARMNRMGTAFEVQITASQQLEIAGERRMRLHAAGAYDVSVRRKLDQSRFETRIHVRAQFALAVLARERAEMATAIRDFTATTVRHTQAQVDAGEISPLRARMAEVALAQATQNRREAERAYRAACRDLATQAGWPVDVPLEPIGELRAPMPAGSAQAYVDDVLADHPELAALDAALDSARARARAERREAWPEPTLGGYVAREHPPGTPFADFVALATISVPLPLWRRNQGDRARADAAVRVAETDLAMRRYELTQRVHRMVDAVDTSAQRVEGYARDVLPRFQENLDLLQRAFELGEIDIVGVSVGRQAFLDAQRSALDTWEDYITALREVELALGRDLGWSPGGPTRG
ncbi:MAG TPA: TolC family protein [Nannocystaceae bacterium]|nr:TolC family protein [Nannocystaceae bacterium]